MFSWLKREISWVFCESVYYWWVLFLHSFCSVTTVVRSLNSSRTLVMQSINSNGTDSRWKCKRIFGLWLLCPKNGFTCAATETHAQHTRFLRRYETEFSLITKTSLDFRTILLFPFHDSTKYFRFFGTKSISFC